ncbi:MAG: hypothetical protein WB471_13590 [Nocardioides sp.]
MHMSRPVRLAAAASLVTTAALSIVSLLFEPGFPAEAADRLAAIEEAGTSATVSIVSFALAQLPFLAGVVAIALYSLTTAPKTAVAGGILAVLGGFGHAVVGGIGLSQLTMAASPERAAMAEAVESIEYGPAIPFMAMGLLGTVLGLLLLGIALFRSRLVPRWIPVALWAFILVEFVGTSLSEWASPAAGALYLAAFSGLALQLIGPDRANASKDAASATASSVRASIAEGSALP